MAEIFDKVFIAPELLGRADKLAQLLALAEQACKGSGQLVLLSGEAGTGKTRLVEEFKTRLSSHAPLVSYNVQVLKGSCFEPDRSLPYAPLLDLIQTFLSFANPEQAEELYQHVLDSPELAKLLTEMAVKLPLPQNHQTNPVSDRPEQAKRRLFQAFTQYFCLVAARQPLVLWFEDLHWSDESSLEFLVFLSRRLVHQPILVLLTYRKNEVNRPLADFLLTLDRERNTVELGLSPLTRKEVETLLRTIFNLKPPARLEFLEAVYKLTEGNPFFVEEVTKALIAAGNIYFSEGCWQHKPLSQFKLPTSVTVGVQRRVDQLSSAARQVLTLAAIAGRRFDFGLLQHLTRLDETGLLELIKELIRAQLVVEETVDRFAFRHALIQEVVYSDLLGRERRALHNRIAQALEELFGRSIESHLSDLAYHYYEAGIWDKVLDYAQQAGQQAQALYSFRAAAEYFDRALEAARQLGQTAPALWRLRGQAYEILGNFEAAHQAYCQTLELGQAEGARLVEWQSLLDLGALWRGRDYEQAGHYLKRALDLAIQRDEPLAQAQSLNLIGNWYINLDKVQEATQYHQESLKLFQAANDQAGVAATLDLLGSVNFMGGDLGEAAHYFSRAFLIFRSLDDRRGMVNCLIARAMQGSGYMFQTRFWPVTARVECEKAYLEGLELARAMGWRASEAQILIHYGQNLASQGEYGQALEIISAGLDIALEIEHGPWSMAGYLFLGILYQDILELALAGQYLEKAYQQAKDMKWSFGLGMTSGFLAINYLRFNPAATQEILHPLLKAELPMDTLAQRQCWAAQAELLRKIQKPEAALQIIERLIATAASSTSQLKGLVSPYLAHQEGLLLQELERYSEAETALKSAAEAAQIYGFLPQFWRIEASLFELYRATARTEAARKALASARASLEKLAGTLLKTGLEEKFRHNTLAGLIDTPQPLFKESTQLDAGGLTSREQEVAVQVARGKSNRVISEEFFISERTVEKHIEHIMTKLDFTSRSQIAVWVMENKLIKSPKN